MAEQDVDIFDCYYGSGEEENAKRQVNMKKLRQERERSLDQPQAQVQEEREKLLLASVLFFIYYNKRNSGSEWSSLVDCSGYSMENDPPLAIKATVDKPRRAEENDRDRIFANSLYAPLQTAFDLFVASDDRTQFLRKILTDETDATPYAPGYPEMFHYLQVLDYDLSQRRGLAKDSMKGVVEFTMGQASEIVLNKLRTYWLREIKGSQCTYGKSLEFSLIAAELDKAGNFVKFSKCRAEPDAAFSKYGLPCFLVGYRREQTPSQKDKALLLAQMASTLRLTQTIRRISSTEIDDLFVMGVLFTKQRMINRYFFYYDKAEKICFHEKVYKMFSAYEFTLFLMEFYNYTAYAKNNGLSRSTEQEISYLAQRIRSSALTILIRANTDGLRESGYRLMCEEQNTYHLLNEFPNDMAETCDPEGDTCVLAKLLRGKSEELALLRELAAYKSPHNHVIPVINTVQSRLGPIIIFPLECPFGYYTEERIPRISIQLSRQLVEGVAFLHKHGIAHMDIKPDNIVSSHPKSDRLRINDFDHAVRCNNEDELCTEHCGTVGWSAPEVVLEDDYPRPFLPFSPIRTDLFSCGKTIQYFIERGGKEDSDLSLLSRLLMGNDPKRRPLLHKIVDEGLDFWTSGRLLQVQRLKAYVAENDVQEPGPIGDADAAATLENGSRTGITVNGHSDDRKASVAPEW